MSAAGWHRVLSFDSDSPEFRRGAETGMAWEQARQLGPGERMDVTIHADSAEMVIWAAEALGLAFSAEPLGEDWLAVSLAREQAGG